MRPEELERIRAERIKRGKLAEAKTDKEIIVGTFRELDLEVPKWVEELE